MSPARPIFLFDGDCGVCENGTRSMRRRFDPPVTMSAYQGVALNDLGVTEDDVLEGPVLVRVDGSHVIGPRAIAEMLRLSRRPYRGMGTFLLLPGVRHLLHAAGPFLYRQRYRLPGATETCQLPG